MRVLMLGWEYPPLISGGLGTACQGIVGGLVGAGAKVLFVAPRLSGAEDARGAELVAAGDVAPAAPAASSETARGHGSVRQAFVRSPLAPYQTRASYRALLERLQTAEHDPAPAPAARAAPFEGGYGASLPSEVERYARAVGEIARRERFDVIHAHDWMTYPAGSLARRISGRPLVFHVHACEHDRSGGGADPEICAVEQAALDEADAVVCVSGYTRSVLAAHYRLAPERVRVVHNAVERAPNRNGAAPARALPRAPREQEAGPPTVLFLGRLTRQKGPDFFLQAAAAIAARRADVRFVVGGDGDLRASLIERAADLGLARRVFFTGFLKQEEVERLYAEADVYVMPSLSEPFGIAPLEALARDTPVIVARASGVAEALASSPKVEYGDVADLADKVLLLLEHPELRAALVAAGQAELARLGWEKSAQRLLALYAELTGRPAARRAPAPGRPRLAGAAP